MKIPELITYVGKFFGPDKIVKITKLKGKTSLGDDAYRIDFENEGDYDTVTEKSLKDFTCEEFVDASAFIQMRVELMAPAFQRLFLGFGIRRNEIELFTKFLSMNLNNSFDTSLDYLWTGNRKTFIPGMDVLHERNIIEADLILLKKLNDS